MMPDYYGIGIIMELVQYYHQLSTRYQVLEDTKFRVAHYLDFTPKGKPN